MSTAIALLWNTTEPQFAVAEDGHVKETGSASLEAGMSPTAIGGRLASALGPHGHARAKVIVAIERNALEWQHLSLPPCPADELPDLVRMQSDREFSATDEDVGFDYLTLVGDEQTPYQVLTVALSSSELAKIREVCQAANLTLERVVPLAGGWPALAGRSDNSLGTNIYVAPQGSEATLWATSADSLLLFRQFQLAGDAEPSQTASAIGSELKRSLLSLSQQSNQGPTKVTLVGNQQDRLGKLTERLNQQLDVEVQSLDVSQRQPTLAQERLSSQSSLPLAGVAIEESTGSTPLVDLLHPHRRPQPQVNVRTYALAATAGGLLLLLLAWSGYANLNAPLHQAAADQAELTILEESLDELAEHERKAGAVRDWQAQGPNLLVHLEQFSKSIRPEPLDADDFPADQDIVLERFELTKRQLTLDAMARNSRAVQPLETRLRASAYRPQRGKSDPSEAVKGYPWHFKSTIEITSASDHAESSASETPAQEPQS